MEKKKRHSVWENIRYVYKGVFHWQPVMVPMMIFYTMVATATMYVIPYMTKLIIDQVQYGTSERKLIEIVVICMALQLVLDLIQGFINNQKWWRFIYCRVKFIHKNMKKIMTMDYERLENPKVLDMSEKAIRACGSEQNGINAMMTTVFDTLVVAAKIVSAVAVIGTLNLALVAIIVGITLIQYLPVRRAKLLDKKEAWDLAAPFFRKQNYFNNMMRDFSFGKDIRLYNMKNWLFGKRRENDSKLQERENKSRDIWLKCNTINQAIQLVEEIILYGWLVYAVLFQHLSIANFTIYLVTIHNFAQVMGEILWKLSDLKRQSEEVSDYRQFVEEIQDVQSHLMDQSVPLSQVIKSGNYDFEFENVSFQYAGQENFALKNFNLKVNTGERLAVVGLNGAGKSTFIKLLCRLYDPTQGRILLNGVDIRTFPKVEYYQLFAPVFQNVEIYAFSMASNISMNEWEETDLQKAESVLRQADLLDRLDH